MRARFLVTILSLALIYAFTCSATCAFVWGRAQPRRRRAMRASMRHLMRLAERSNEALPNLIVLGITIPVLSLCRATGFRDLN